MRQTSRTSKLERQILLFILIAETLDELEGVKDAFRQEILLSTFLCNQFRRAQVRIIRRFHLMKINRRKWAEELSTIPMRN